MVLKGFAKFCYLSRKPLLFHDKYPGFFCVHYSTHGTSSFKSHLKEADPDDIIGPNHAPRLATQPQTILGMVSYPLY